MRSNSTFSKGGAKYLKRQAYLHLWKGFGSTFLKGWFGSTFLKDWDLVPSTTDKYIVWYIVGNAPVRTFLYIISYVNIYFIILMFVIYKYDGLLNVVNLLLTENGIKLF